MALIAAAILVSVLMLEAMVNAVTPPTPEERRVAEARAEVNEAWARWRAQMRNAAIVAAWSVIPLTVLVALACAIQQAILKGFYVMPEADGRLPVPRKVVREGLGERQSAARLQTIQTQAQARHTRLGSLDADPQRGGSGGGLHGEGVGKARRQAS